jgi:putative hydrolase of the HAD superfamily
MTGTVKRLRHAAPRGFADTQAWVFDLDNTLYPAKCNLFAQISQRMGQFISERFKVDAVEARAIQKRHYLRYGTTLAGLMTEEGIAPKDFLDCVHDIDYTPVPPSPDLDRALAKLPGRKLVFTNGTRAHAERTLDRLGVSHHMEAIFDIIDADYLPKPAAPTYARFLAAHGVEGGRSAMFEDLPHNLTAAETLGMTTVLVGPGIPGDPSYADIDTWTELPGHVHHITDDLPAFLAELKV